MDRKAIWKRLGGTGTPTALQLFDALSSIDAQSRRLGSPSLLTDHFGPEDYVDAAEEMLADPQTPEETKEGLRKALGIG
jgi:hypothetical protein